MKLVYIAGPYRAPTTWDVDQNIHRAREIGAIVAGLGAYPIIPHSNTAHMDGAADDVLWLAGIAAHNTLDKCAPRRLRHRAG
jgi:hypothetical protein